MALYIKVSHLPRSVIKGEKVKTMIPVMFLTYYNRRFGNVNCYADNIGLNNECCDHIHHDRIHTDGLIGY
jgi:hypothetical protein